jgi:hypothetical protein
MKDETPYGSIWELGRRIVEFEQGGKGRAGYGEQLMERLSHDLTGRFGKGFSRQNLQSMRQFYTTYPPEQICQTMSGKSVFPLNMLAEAFPLSWSHYVLLISRSRSTEARVFYHRRLRCLVLIDLKLGRFTHADAGQMHLYLNYAREHWTHEEENPSVGLILCPYKNSAVVKYALEGLANKVMAAEYRTALPDEGRLAQEIEATRRLLDERTKRIKGDAE